MTSFDIFESSDDGSEPLEIYTITMGTSTFRYTSNSHDVVVNSHTYVASGIKRSKIATSNKRNEKITLTFSGDNAFAQSFLGIAPGERAFVNIIRLQRNEVPTYDTQALIYKGQVAAGSYGRDGTEIQLTATSVEAAADRKIPRFTFMGMCNHILFDSRCKKGTSGFVAQGAASGASGNTIQVAECAAFADGFFNGGWCKPVSESDYRLVIKHVGSTLTLLLPFSGNVDGSTVDVFAGCDHTVGGDCSSKFDNVENFGGFPFVPTKNLFATGLD